MLFVALLLDHTYRRVVVFQSSRGPRDAMSYFVQQYSSTWSYIPGTHAPGSSAINTNLVVQQQYVMLYVPYLVCTWYLVSRSTRYYQ